MGAKFQFPTTNRVAVAIGGNYQILWAGHDEPAPINNAGQMYLATTYAGNFFNWPAETTVVFGYTMGADHRNSNIDFGIGFDLVLLPDVFQNFVHWILDFSNFTYITRPPYPLSPYRGVLCTGLRFDFASIIRQERFKFAVDILMTDAFDENRGFSIGGVFGIGLN
jgi:hypothetical protein